jgi:hypothetical protein
MMKGENALAIGIVAKDDDKSGCLRRTWTENEGG